MRAFAQKPKATQQNTSAKSTMPGRVHFGQSREVNSILHFQRTIGNQSVLRLLGQAEPDDLEARSSTKEVTRFAHDFSQIPVHATSPARVQAKLTVGAPGDNYEQEADRVSEQVMRMPQPQLQRACPCGGGCPKCQTEQLSREHESLQTQRVQANDTGQVAAPPVVHEVLRSPGQPLDPATRAFMEPRFGHDFSRVRVHSGSAATESAREVNARAYTVGSNIVFGAGQLTPGTQEGRRLIAHELTHVVQQSGADGMSVAVQRQPMTEAEALRALAEAERDLQQMMEVAQDYIESKGGKPGKPPSRPSVDRPPPGARRLPSRDWLNRRLIESAAGGDPAARTVMDGLADASARVRQAQRDLTAARGGATTPSGTTTRFKAPTTTKTPTRTAGGEVTVPQRGSVTPSGGGASKGVTTASGEVTVPKPNPVPKPPSPLRARLSAAKGSIGAGIKGAFSAPSLASMIPDVVLAVADIAAAREAIKTIQVKFVKEGFAKGVAAGVMRWSEEEVGSNLKNRVTPFRIQGMGDPAGFLTRAYIFQLAEAYENYGVDVGYQFSSSRPKKWKDDMQAKGFAALAQYGYHFGEDPQALFEYGFIDKLAWVLRSTTNPIVEEAIESGERQ